MKTKEYMVVPKQEHTMNEDVNTSNNDTFCKKMNNLIKYSFSISDYNNNSQNNVSKHHIINIEGPDRHGWWNV